METSYNGAPAYEDLRNCVPFSVKLPGGVITFPQGLLDNDDLRKLMTYVVMQWDARIEKLPIEAAWIVGYWAGDYRPNRNNPDVLSCHSSGTAIDIWAVEHPNRADTLTASEKDTLARIGHETGHEIRFGVPGLVCPVCGRSAGWSDSSSADNMHAEAARYDTAAWAAAAANLPGSVIITPIPVPNPQEEDRDMTPKEIEKLLADVASIKANTSKNLQDTNNLRTFMNGFKRTVELSLPKVIVDGLVSAFIRRGWGK